MSVGKYTYGNPRIHWGGATKLTIGKFCSIANNCNVYLGGNHRTDWVTTYPFGTIHKNIFNNSDGTGHPSTKGDVNIGNDVWIGDNVTIMSGVTIGDGAVIANNSHVVKDVKPYSITGGNPAEFIKNRFTENQIDKLLEIKWWNWDDDKINKFTPLLCNHDIDNFINSVSEPVQCFGNLEDHNEKTQLKHTNKNVGFFIRHFTERGTEVAAYDYAHYNEKILGNKSYIIYFTDEGVKKYGFPDIKHSFAKFSNRFEMIGINDITDMKDVIEKHKLDFFYTQTQGGQDIYQFNNNSIWDRCKTIKHCVFDTLCPESDYYLSLSNYLNIKLNTSYPVLPYIVDLPNTDIHLRNELDIPEDAIVLGRYGGFDKFDLPIAKNAIVHFLDNNKTNNIYFLFMNTAEFYSHQNIIHLDRNIDLLYKTKFINTCDAMIHARSEGETFGLSIAEFSIKNKPIITCPCGDLEHILLLRDKAILYNNTEELINIFSNIQHVITRHSDWNCYREYTPEKVMNRFNKIISNDCLLDTGSF